MPPTSELRVALDASTGIRESRRRLRAWLTDAGVGDPTLDEVLVAVGEATTNALEHSGARAQPERPAVCMCASMEEDRVRVTVTDSGRWREQPNGGRHGHRGRGRMIMAALVDQVSVRTGPAGTTVELVKELHA